MDFQELIEGVGKAVDAAGVAAIVIGAAVASVLALGRLLRRGPSVYSRYRRSLGRAILLGLELLVAADIIRTVAAFAALGLEPRGTRDVPGDKGLRQIFFRLSDVIVETLGSTMEAGEGPARLWGVTYEVADIDATAALLGEHIGRVKDAVQPGRRITTLRHRELGMSVPTALISRRG